MPTVLAECRELQNMLNGLAGKARIAVADCPTVVDVIVTACEINDRHGTGVLLKRIFEGSRDVAVIYSMNVFQHENLLGAQVRQVSHQGLPRPEVYANVLKAVRGLTVRRVLCVPYFPDDALTAIALKDLFQAPLCTYLMDDNNLYSTGLPDSLVRELLAKSALRLAISPEMRIAYETKYRFKTWFVPAVVSDEQIVSAPLPASRMSQGRTTGVLIGNIWEQRWLDLLRTVVSQANLTLHWYCTGGNGQLKIPVEDLARDGITVFKPKPLGELTQLLPEYAFAVVPSGPLDAEDRGQAIARLSLPSRIPFLMACGQVPIIVLGSGETAAAHCMKWLGIGTSCPYDGPSFARAVAEFTTNARRQAVREACARLAPRFSAHRMAEWLWESLARGEPCDRRFEELVSWHPGGVALYIDPPPPGSVSEWYHGTFKAFRRLRDQGYTPDYVLDVGASTGVWSHTVNQVYPEARFILVEPLLSRYDAAQRAYHIGSHANFQVIEAAVGDTPGRAQFQVSSDLYGSSLMKPKDFRSYETVDVEVVTLDEIARRCALAGRGVLKIDVQYAEHIVLRGADDLLKSVDAIVLELSLYRYDARAKTLAEMLAQMHALGFDYADDLGDWRAPADGRLLEKDVLFLRRGLLPDPLSHMQTE